MNYVRQDTPTAFAAPVDRNDLELWSNSRYPVLFIVYHPKDDKLYCKEVRSYVKSTLNAFQAPHRILFDKSKDEFNATYFTQIKTHADVGETRVSFQQKEELYSNLFPVRRAPALFHASTTYTNVADIRNAAAGHLPPIAVIDGRLFSFCDLRSTLGDVRRFCDSDVESIAASEWLESDPERQRDYVFLLNQLLGHLRYKRGLRYNRDFQRTYFPRGNDTDLEFSESWFNVRTNRKVDPRIVVKYYEYGKDRFWRHLACHLSFLRLGSNWFLRIIPKYFFTSDGRDACNPELVGPYTTRLKAMEHNMQVLNHVLFWGDYLADSDDYIACRIDGKMVLNIDRMPLSGIAGFAIPDDPAAFEEKAPPIQLDLFGPQLENEDDSM